MNVLSSIWNLGLLCSSCNSFVEHITAHLAMCAQANFFCSSFYIHRTNLWNVSHCVNVSKPVALGPDYCIKSATDDQGFQWSQKRHGVKCVVSFLLKFSEIIQYNDISCHQSLLSVNQPLAQRYLLIFVWSCSWLTFNQSHSRGGEIEKGFQMLYVNTPPACRCFSLRRLLKQTIIMYLNVIRPWIFIKIQNTRLFYLLSQFK